MQQRVSSGVPKTIRAREIADGLGIHVQTVWRWSKKGKLPKPTKLSHRVTVWDRAAVIARFPILVGQEG